MRKDEKHVLILEDNVALAMEWKNSFELNGIKVTVTHNSKDATEYLKLETFDLVVTDLFIRGGQDGLGILVQLIRMTGPRPPVITVTGAFLPSGADDQANLFLEQAKRLGASVTIQKPFPAGELVALATDIWAQETRTLIS